MDIIALYIVLFVIIAISAYELCQKDDDEEKDY